MKPRLRIVAGRPVEVRQESQAITEARKRFGRAFGHEPNGNFLRHPELVLSRWARRAWYFNTNPQMPVPPGLVCHFKNVR